MKYETLLKLIAGVLIAVVPASLSYCQSRNEALARDERAARENDAGYKALTASVQRLEEIVALQGRTLTLIMTFDTPVMNGLTPGGARPLATPTFEDLPSSPAAALRQQMEPQ